jgi:hypothetical protein
LFIFLGGFAFMAGASYLCQSIIHRLCRINLISMGNNKQAFIMYENEWMTVRNGYLRELTTECKNEVERIYKEEIDVNWLPNRWCKSCYYDAIRRLIIKFGL